MCGTLFNLCGAVFGGTLSYGLIVAWRSLGAEPVVSVPLSDVFHPLGPFASAASVLSLISLVDFLHYWRHRLEHRFFWSIHKVHHSPTELHAANSIGHPFQVIPEFLVVTAPMTLFTFDGPEVPISVAMIVFFWARFVHSPVSFHLGPLRFVVVDNGFHRIHHSLEPRHVGRNFGVFFSVWDQIFRTAYFPKRDEWPRTGVQGVLPPRTVTQFLLMPLRP